MRLPSTDEEGRSDGALDADVQRSWLPGGPAPAASREKGLGREEQGESCKISC